MKMANPLRLDERNINTVCHVCSIMYGITWLALAGILLYRQFVLGQSVEEFNDIAMLFTFNVIFAIGAILYFGGVPFFRIKPVTVGAIYVGFVAIGFLFTMFKYTILLERDLSMMDVLDKLSIVLTICAAILATYVLFAYFGKRRMDREIE